MYFQKQKDQFLIVSPFYLIVLTCFDSYRFVKSILDVEALYEDQFKNSFLDLNFKNLSGKNDKELFLSTFLD